MKQGRKTRNRQGMNRHCFLRYLMLASALLTGSINGQGQWTSLGPQGGMASCFVVHPQDSSTVFLGSANGVFRSHDGGSSWVRSSDGLTDPRVEALVIDPSNPSRLIAASQSGIFLSQDSGLSWSDSSQGLDGQTIQDLIIDPADPTVLYAATLDGIFKSSDGGLSWLDSSQGLSLDRLVLKLLPSPSQPGALYAVTLQFGVYRSLDQAGLWTRISSNQIGFFKGALAIDPLDETIYAASDRGVMKSSDGVQWQNLGSSDTALLAFDPGHPSRLLSSTRFSLRYSDDGGLSWVGAGTTDFAGKGLRSLIFDPSNPQARFASGVEGSWRSLDGGESWRIVRNGLRIETARSVAPDPANPLGLYLGTQNGEMRSIDAGANWDPIDSLDPAQIVRKVLVHPTNPRRLLSAQGRSIRQSLDGGRSWQRVFSNADLVRTVTRDHSDPDLLYAGIGNFIGLFRSENGGQDWQFNQANPFTSINDIAIDPADSLTLYAGGREGLFKSLDGGDSWQEAMQGLPFQEIHSVAVDPADSEVVYAGTSSQGVFKSNNGGANWSSLGGPSATIIRSLAIDPLESARLWAGSWGEGVFLSEDGGATWNAFNQGLENPFIWELTMPDSPIYRLFAATLGGLAALPADGPPAALLSLLSEVSGNPFPGGMLTYSMTLFNQGQTALPTRLVASFSPLLDLIEVRAETGHPLLGPGDSTVTWEGTVSGGGQVVVEVRGIVRNSPPGTTLSSLAILSADRDADGVFESSILSSTPSNPAPGSPLVVQTIESSLESDLLAVPYALNIESTFVGLAMANLSASENGLEYLALDEQGNLLEERQDDSLLPVRGQVPFLTTEIFGQPSATLAVRGTNAALQGFFLLGDSASDRLDGIGGPLADSQIHYITAVRSTAQASTHLYLFNSDPTEAADVALQVFDLQGSRLAESEVSLSPFGSIQSTVEELFGPLEVEDGFIRLDASRPVRGFALLADADRFATQPARPPSASETLWAPQAFWNDQQGTTLLRFLNSGNQTAFASIEFRDASGQLLETTPLELAPGQLRVLDLRQLATAASMPSGDGSIEVHLEGGAAGPFPLPAHVLGDVVYDGGVLKTHSSLPMLDRLEGTTQFLQVAQSQDLGIFQGLAIFTPGPRASLVLVEAYSQEGEMTAAGIILVRPGQRFVGLLDDPLLFGEGFEQLGGILRVEAFGNPLATIALFGGPRFLSALQGVSPPPILFPFSLNQPSK